jgi:lysyl-tRNA synthetase class 2
LLIEKG